MPGRPSILAVPSSFVRRRGCRQLQVDLDLAVGDLDGVSAHGVLGPAKTWAIIATNPTGSEVIKCG